MDEFVELPDLAGTDLRELFATEDTNLAACVKRLVDGLNDPNGVISAFASFAGNNPGA